MPNADCQMPIAEWNATSLSKIGFGRIRTKLYSRCQAGKVGRVGVRVFMISMISVISVISRCKRKAVHPRRAGTDPNRSKVAAVEHVTDSHVVDRSEKGSRHSAFSFLSWIEVSTTRSLLYGRTHFLKSMREVAFVLESDVF
jgi:hypothetical protein